MFDLGAPELIIILIGGLVICLTGNTCPFAAGRCGIGNGWGIFDRAFLGANGSCAIASHR